MNLFKVKKSRGGGVRNLDDNLVLVSLIRNMKGGKIV